MNHSTSNLDTLATAAMLASKIERVPSLLDLARELGLIYRVRKSQRIQARRGVNHVKKMTYQYLN